MRSDRASLLALLPLIVLAVALSGCAPTGPASQPSSPLPKPVTAATSTVSATDIGGFTRPTAIATPDDGSGRMFVAEQGGTIRIVKGGVAAKAPALDIADRLGSSSGELGLLGIAFPKDFATKRYAYIYFTGAKNASQLYRVRMSATDPDAFDPATLQLILAVDQPYPNHKGGQLAFGPDGYLYVGLGDGGGAGDPGDRAQDLRQLLGKILRLDTESTPDAPGYRIPADNPFVSRAGARPEIWAYGLRNPWRFSFDSETGDLWIADVGQDQWEEIDFVAAGTKGGLNFGWPLYEGNDYFKATTKQAGYVWPVYAYTHRQGISVTGGYVYRGSRYPAMQGKYVFGDYGSGNIWTVTRNGDVFSERLASESFYRISCFGVDGSGELWVADHSAGRIHHVGDLTR